MRVAEKGVAGTAVGGEAVAVGAGSEVAVAVGGAGSVVVILEGGVFAGVRVALITGVTADWSQPETIMVSRMRTQSLRTIDLRFWEDTSCCWSIVRQ